MGNWKKAIIVLLGAAAVAGIFLGVAWWRIAVGVRECRETARAACPEAADDTLALMEYVGNAQHSLKMRNRAVWALGRIGDPRARPLLCSLYTGAPCDHERFLCQLELAKAIRRCGGRL